VLAIRDGVARLLPVGRHTDTAQQNHIVTATVTHADYEAWLERLAPHEPVSSYRHNRTGEDNADAHMKRQIMGREVVVAITAGKLDFGPWEQIFYGEFDGGRRKRVLIKIIGE
jgi:secondary thiamine-phosphate synthase enzyme